MGEYRQGYVEPNESLRLGKCEVGMGNLLEGRSFNAAKNQSAHEPVSVQPRRNIETGEVEV